MNSFKAKIMDLEENDVYPAYIVVEDNIFKEVTPISLREELDFEGVIVPGYIDSHIHIESTFLTPSSFAEAVLPLGTCSVIADPHEVANVLGVEGIQFMIDDGNEVPFDFYFTAPSSVPATEFESSGAVIDGEDIKNLLKKDEIVGLGEVMNFSGVTNRDPSIISKLKIAKSLNKPIDGHSPQLGGNDLKKYFYWNDDFEDSNSTEGYKDSIDVDNNAITNHTNQSSCNTINTNTTISTDHESSSFDEAIEKKSLGMKIMVREGSSAKNMESLFDLKKRLELLSNQDFLGKISADDFGSVLTNPIFDFLVTDDISPEDLIKGHLNTLVKKAIELGIDKYEAIKMVTLNPSNHYNLNSGLIAKGRIANFILVDNLDDFNVKKTFIHGKLVAENGEVLFNRKKSKVINNFSLNEKKPEDFEINLNSLNNLDNQIDESIDLKTKRINLIEVFDGELLTNKIQKTVNIGNGVAKEDVPRDILKLAVAERYGNNNIGLGFVKGFNLKEGAIASSVAHDSHNIVVVGTNSYYMAKAVNLIKESEGGLAVVSSTIEKILKLPIAGIMTNKSVKSVIKEKLELNKIVKSLGVNLKSPFMTLSFLALLVIPSLKLSDKGLFDVDKFEFIDIFIND
ncbi:MAG: amidohydrolase family protein [Methanobrevibacter sp.]|jgi:adenine deaminase|nr:amidohydrolase family protein [Candidatus Methanovirga australis]